MNEKLNDIFEICLLNSFEFTLTKEGGVNYINYSIEGRKIEINIPNPDDTSLNELLDKKLKELQQLLN